MKAMFQSSMLEFRKVQNVAICSLLVAMSIILGFYSIQLTTNLRISFAILPVAIAAYLYGPAVAAILGGSIDLLNFIIKPLGPFFPGFTITNILTGLVYGIILYKKNITLGRSVISNVIIGIFLNLFLNTFWLYLLYGTPYIANLIARFPKELLMTGVNSILIYILIKTLKVNMLLQKH